MAKQIDSVSEAALARAQIPAAALALREPAATEGVAAAGERIAGREHVARRRQLWRRWRGAGPRRGTRRWTIVGVIHPQPTAAEVVTVEASDRIRCLRFGSVLDESEPA